MTLNAESEGTARGAGLRRPLFGLTVEHLLVLTATLIGLSVRLWLALRSEVWLDEANSVLIALSPLRDFAATLAPDSSPPFYYLMLKGWASLGPFTAFWFRVPSLLFGCATIPVAWWAGSRMDRPWTGVILAWLLSLHPLHVHYSEEIRMYSMLVLLGLLFFFAVFHHLRTTGAFLPAMVSGAALAYTHYYGLVLAGVGILTAFLVLTGRRRRVLFCAGGIGLAFLPWIPVFRGQLGNPHHVAWIRAFWDRYPEGAGILRSLQAFLPGGMTYSFVPLNGLPFQGLLVAFGILPFLVLALRTERRKLLAPVGLPLIVGLGTLLVVIVESYVGTPVYLAGRSDVVVLPLVLLGLAMALARTGPWTRGPLLGIWVVLSAAGLGVSAESLRKVGNREMAAAVDSAGCSTLIATGYTYAPMVFYQMVEGKGTVVAPFPIDVGDHPGNMDPRSYTPADLARDAHLLARAYPPGAGLCILSIGESFSGPLADAYPAEGARARPRGVYFPSTMRGTPYLLTAFSGEGA